MNAQQIIEILKTQNPSQRKKYLTKIIRITGNDARLVEKELRFLIETDKNNFKKVAENLLKMTGYL